MSSVLACQAVLPAMVANTALVLSPSSGGEQVRKDCAGWVRGLHALTEKQLLDPLLAITVEVAPRRLTMAQQRCISSSVHVIDLQAAVHCLARSLAQTYSKHGVNVCSV